MPLLVFDLDGTLIDSRRDLADAANALVVRHGGTALPVESIAQMVGNGAAMLVRRALAAAGVDGDARTMLPEFLELYDERLLRTTHLYDGFPEVLEALTARATLALLTNKPLAATERILTGLGIAPFFGAVLGGDGPLPRKPDPAGLRHLMVQASADPERTVMIGDSPVDLATARAAATRVCLARYGFGFRISRDDLRGDELFADEPAELPRVLAAVL
jgi:phosphoglycolate phosphatase